MIEDSLCADFTEQAALYAQALELARAVVMTDDAPLAPQLQPIFTLLEQVKAIDGRMSDARQEWHASGRQPGERLRGQVGTVTALIQALSQRFAEIEAKAREEQKRLLPELDGLRRALRMRHAYAMTAALSD